MHGTVHSTNYHSQTSKVNTDLLMTTSVVYCESVWHHKQPCN